MDLVKLLVQSTGSDAHTLPQLLTGTGSYDSENTTISGLFSDPVSDTGEDKLKVELTASEAFTTSKAIEAKSSSYDDVSDKYIDSGSDWDFAGEWVNINSSSAMLRGSIFEQGSFVYGSYSDTTYDKAPFFYNPVGAEKNFWFGYPSFGPIAGGMRVSISGSVSASGDLYVDNIYTTKTISGSKIRGGHASAGGVDGIDKDFNFNDGDANNHAVIILNGIITQWNIT